MTTTTLADLHTKDVRRTAEHNLLVKENRELRAENARLLVAKLPTSEDYDILIRERNALREATPTQRCNGSATITAIRKDGDYSQLRCPGCTNCERKGVRVEPSIEPPKAKPLICLSHNPHGYCETCGSGKSKPESQPSAAPVHSQISTRIAREIIDLAEDHARLTEERDQLQRDRDRLFQDRYDLLGVKTTDGLTASEWMMRTAKAEREGRELREALVHMAGQADCEMLESDSGYYLRDLARRALRQGREDK